MAFGAITSSKNAGNMGFAVTEVATGGMPGTLPPRRAARDSDLLRYLMNSLPCEVGLRSRDHRDETPNSFLKLWLFRFSQPDRLRWVANRCFGFCYHEKTSKTLPA